MLYLYGVVRSRHRPANINGLGDSPVTIIESGPIGVAASEFEARDIDPNDARVHLDVLVDLLSGGPVLPLRLGTVAADATDARTTVLDAHREDFARALDEFDGLVEVQVDADDDETQVLTEIAAGQGMAPPARNLADSIELGQRVGAALMTRRQEVAERITSVLREFAVDEVPRALIRGPEDPVLRWAFLVKAADLTAFDEATVSLGAEFPAVSIRLIGPLPPSHFLDRPRVPLPDADPFRSRGTWGW